MAEYFTAGIDVHHELDRLESCFARKPTSKSARVLFYEQLLSLRDGSTVETDVILRGIEMTYRISKDEESATLLDKCLDYVRHANVSPSVLSLLASLATYEHHHDRSPTSIARQLLAVENISTRQNQLVSMTDAIIDNDDKTGRLGSLFDGQLISARVPLSASDIIQNKENTLTPIRFVYTYAPVRKRDTPIAVVSSPIDPSIMFSKREDFEKFLGEQQQQERELSLNLDNLPKFSPKDPTLFGALAHPRRVPCSIDSRLSFPDVLKQNGGVAPDLLQEVLRQKLEQATCQTNDNVSFDDSTETSSCSSHSQDGTTSEWVVAGRLGSDIPERSIFGWEEEVRDCFRYEMPQTVESKCLQYRDNGLLSSERGLAWFEHTTLNNPSMDPTADGMLCPLDVGLLLRDCMYALVGVPGNIFRFDAHQVLNPAPCRVFGVSHLSLKEMLALVARCGNSYRALNSIVNDSTVLMKLKEITNAIKETLADVLIEYQKTVTNLFLRHEIRSPLTLSLHLPALLNRLGPVLELFNHVDGNRHESTIAFLHHLYISSFDEGITTHSPQRVMLEKSMQSVVATVHSWIFKSSDDVMVFHTPFVERLHENQLSDQVLEDLVFHKKTAPFKLSLPSFCKSKFLGMSAAGIAENIIKCGLLLRLMRHKSSSLANELCKLCTTVDGVSMLFQSTHSSKKSELFSQTQRIASLSKPITLELVSEFENLSTLRGNTLERIVISLCEETMRVRQEKSFLRLQKLKEEAEESLMQSRQLFAEHKRKKHEELVKRKAKSRAILEQEMKLIEERKLQKKLDRETRHRKEREKFQREEAEIQKVEQDLVDEYNRLMHEQEVEQAKLKQAVTKIQLVKQEPGGTTSLTSLLHFKSTDDVDEASTKAKLSHSPDEGSYSSLGNLDQPTAVKHVRQAPGGETSLTTSLHFKSAPERKTSVKISHRPGDDSSLSLGSLHQEMGEPDHTTIKVLQQTGGQETTMEAYSPTIRVLQSPGGAMSDVVETTSSIRMVEHPLTSPEKPELRSVKVLQSPGGHMSSDPVYNPSVKIVQEPGGETTLSFADNSLERIVPSVRVLQTPGGKSTWSFDEEIEKKVVQEIVQKITVQEDDTKENEGRTSSVRITQAPGGTSTIQSLLYYQEDSDVVVSERVKADLPPTHDKDGDEGLVETVFIKEEVKDEALIKSWTDTYSRFSEEIYGVDDIFEGEGYDEAECAPLDIVLAKGFVSPVLAQCHLIERAFTQLVLADPNFFPCLENLKDLLLMGNGHLFGDVVGRFIEIRLQEIDYISGKGRVLQQILSSNDDIIVDNIAYKLTNARHSPKVMFSEYEHFHFLLVEYEVEWPLTVLVSQQEDIAVYNKIHRFLLSIKYSSSLCKMIWKQIGRERGKAKGHELVAWMTSRWHQVRNLLYNMENYILTQILCEYWNELVQKVKNVGKSSSSDKLRGLHQEFLAKAKSCCFLDGSASSKIISRHLSRLVKSTVTFYERSSKALLNGDRLVNKSLTSSWEGYLGTQTFLLNGVKAAATKRSVGATNLLLHINLNEYF